jgi:hypothetical protein
MSILTGLGIWFLISAALTPVIGYYLSEAAQRTEEQRGKASFAGNEGLDLHGTQRGV